MNELVIAVCFSLGFNLVVFIPAFIFKTDKLTDISYALTFIAVGIFSFLRSEKTIGHILLIIAILLWAVRLGSFLYRRILRMKVDKRFDGRRDNFFKFLGFWLIQAITVPVVLLSSLLYFDTDNSSTTAISIFGLMIFGLGLLIETIADNQKFAFSGDPANKDKWIESGIWGVSRHPNYLGEIMVWSGLYVFAFSSLDGYARLAGLISPIYIACLILFVSGVPILEKAADKKWAQNEKYLDYKRRTPVLLPFRFK
jgi:steroid 5-alpha reductase family enzyme